MKSEKCRCKSGKKGVQKDGWLELAIFAKQKLLKSLIR